MSSQIKHTHSHQDTPLSPYTFITFRIFYMNLSIIILIAHIILVCFKTDTDSFSKKNVCRTAGPFECSKRLCLTACIYYTYPVYPKICKIKEYVLGFSKFGRVFLHWT